MVAEIGRTCLLEVGLKWWKRVKYLCEKTELFVHVQFLLLGELSNVICMGGCSMRGLTVLRRFEYVRGLKRK